MNSKYFKDLRSRITGVARYAKKYEMTEDAFEAIMKVSPASLKLIGEILRKSTAKCTVDSVLVVGDYEDFGYDNERTFQRHRKQLIEAELIRYDGVYYYVNPRYIIRKNKAQLQYFMELAGLIKKPDKPNGLNW